MNRMLRLHGMAAYHGVLTGHIVFSAAFVAASELLNSIHAPRQVNACRSYSTALALFFPSGMQTAAASNQPALAPVRRGGGEPMSSSIPTSAYVEHFDPELAHHRALLLADPEQLVAHAPKSLEEGGVFRHPWTEHQQSASSAAQRQQP